MSDDTTFVDTNVLVYAYDVDAGAKRIEARRRLRALWELETGRLSTQVLQEMYVTTTRKLENPLTSGEARDIVGTYRAWRPIRPTVDDIVEASELQDRYSLSFWDAMVVTSATRAGASVLLTEDLQHGQRFDDVVVENPFV